MGKLNGRVAIITGSSSGIGEATARLFAEEGARTVLASRTSHRLTRVAEEIRAAGGDVLSVPTDVSDGSSVEALVGLIVEMWGRVDIIVNNAGVLPDPVPVAAMNEAEWDRVFAINTKSIYWMVRHAWPALTRNRGVIVNTASVVAFRGVSGMAAYCASKAAIVMLTRALALEGAEYGIRANCICPGFIDTPMNERLGASQTDPDVWLDDMIGQIPLGRPGAPDEIARGSLYLASDDSSFMTGQILVLDGGATI